MDIQENNIIKLDNKNVKPGYIKCIKQNDDSLLCRSYYGESQTDNAGIAVIALFIVFFIITLVSLSLASRRSKE